MKLLHTAIFILAVFYAKAAHPKTDMQAQMRTGKVDAIVIHAIGGPFCKEGRVRFSYAKKGLVFWQRFFAKQPVVGIHYLVARDGLVARSIAESKVANHALGWNLRSIGIELINAGDGVEPYPQVQMVALISLIKDIRVRNPQITLKNVVRHSDIDKRMFGCAGLQVKRKQDPGILFDYQALIKALS
ncbi:MAG: N-acetylmuramoyl-L-alanine amidase [Oceanospirillaceae bacterium]